MASAPSEIVVFSSPWLPEAHLVQSVLTREGIASRVRNAMVSGLAGEVPFDAVRVEVLVAAEDFAAADAVVVAARNPQGQARPCLSCAESNPPAFEVCWHCGADLPPAPPLAAVD